ncbi:hypothetical protein BsWGS_18777 [Bradybaena similaris]
MNRDSWTSLKFLDHVIVTVLRCFSFMLLLKFSDTIKTPDTCGTYFLLPAFPDCQLFLEAVPCANYTQAVLVTMKTNSGEVIHSFNVSFGAITQHSLRDINTARHEGITVTSNGDISLYVHKPIGDSMIVYPTDALSREYEIPPLTSFGAINGSSNNNSLTNGILYIFSPFNNTTVIFTSLHNDVFSLQSSSTFSSSSSSKLPSTNITLSAFTIHKYRLDSLRTYRLHSNSIFAVVLVQIHGAFSINESLCRNNSLVFLDFVPPFSTKGERFFIAFPNATDFTLTAVGSQNTSIDLTAGQSAAEIILDQSGVKTTVVLKATSCWISASLPVTIYIKITLCSNISLSATITATPSTTTTTTATTTTTCADSGFFLPSLDHYYKCNSNVSKENCACVCPSVFQRIFDPTDFSFFRNTHESFLKDTMPIAFDEIFDLAVSVSHRSDSKNATDVIVTTNSSYIIFRYNLTALKLFTGGNTLQATYCAFAEDKNNAFTHPCNNSDKGESKNQHNKDLETSAHFLSEINECSCEFPQELVNDNTNDGEVNPTGSVGSKLKQSVADEVFFWEDGDEDSVKPLIAVVVSLCVAIFAVIALISGYMLVEIMTRRKHVRNTRIRPFVS